MVILLLVESRVRSDLIPGHRRDRGEEGQGASAAGSLGRVDLAGRSEAQRLTSLGLTKNIYTNSMRVYNLRKIDKKVHCK